MHAHVVAEGSHGRHQQLPAAEPGSDLRRQAGIPVHGHDDGDLVRLQRLHGDRRLGKPRPQRTGVGAEAVAGQTGPLVLAEQKHKAGGGAHLAADALHRVLEELGEVGAVAAHGGHVR